MDYYMPHDYMYTSLIVIEIWQIIDKANTFV